MIMSYTMEPVPETERLEEFRTSPIPKLRLHNMSSNPDDDSESDDSSTRLRGYRRATEPTPRSPLSPLSPGWTSPSTLPYRPRTTSPYARGHLRSRSSASALAPPMTRAQSLPGVTPAGHLIASTQRRPSSPQTRVRTPKKPVDEAFPGRGRYESQDERTMITQSDSTSNSSLPASNPGVIVHNHRQMSPLRNIQYNQTTPSTPSSLASSPLYSASRFQDSYLSTHTSSSVPSTPTSTRSRSPSISSLETIPDTPGAEEAALEAERIARLKAAADAADDEDAADKTRSGLDPPAARGRTLTAGFGRDKRKRWSVCGAERRGDLDLETIWED